MVSSADNVLATAVDPSIARSWERCGQHGLSRSKPARQQMLGPAELKRRREQQRTLVELAASELEIVRRSIAGTHAIAVLADGFGTILDVCGDTKFVERARKVFLQPGAIWCETHEGTNAVGTSIVERRAVQVVGSEHFMDDNRFLICSATPVFNPKGQLAGVVNVSGDARQPPAHSSALVQLAAARIEHEWVTRFCAHDLLVGLHLHPSMVGTANEALLAFRDDVLVAANPAALLLLGMSSDAIDHVQWSDVFRSRPTYGRGEMHALPHAGALHSNVQTPQRSRNATVSVLTNDAPGLSAITVLDGGLWDAISSQMLAKAKRAFEAGIPILLYGETGTGKEVFVRALHRASSRASRPLVPVNCASLPEGILQSELFGYDEGAFTGARRSGSVGHIRRADGGILFLDEIGDMPVAVQAQLLRVLQDGQVIPLGGGRPVQVDFMLVAATHHDLKAAVAEGRFRADLYYRLRHMVLSLPPLRERDIDAIIDAMLTSFGADVRRIQLAFAARQALLRHTWPGNMRELSNLLRTLVSLSEDDSCIGLDSLPDDLTAGICAPQSETLADITDGVLRKALDQQSGNVSAAARQLGLHRSTFYRRLRTEPPPRIAANPEP